MSSFISLKIPLNLQIRSCEPEANFSDVGNLSYFYWVGEYTYSIHGDDCPLPVFSL